MKRRLVHFTFVSLALASCATARLGNTPIAHDKGLLFACDHGSAAACHELALSIEQEHPAEADRFLGRACASSDAESCYDLGVHEAERGDIERSRAHYETACSNKLPPACYNLGMCLIQGPCAIDAARGAGFLRSACDSGELHACLNLGNSYVLGRGVEKRPDEAIRLLTRACDGGIGLACQNLGLLYSSGELVRRDDARASELFERACQEGVPEACEH